MHQYHFLRLLPFLLLPVYGYIQNHSFVFISGWPQSGTSLVHQVLSFNPDMSTVIELCEKLLGKRCISWNHESQWIFPGNIREHIRSGAMCPIESVKEDISLAIQQQLKQYWNLQKPFLIEKSPQAMVKIPMLKSIFSGSKNSKFIVVIKHPVTLNIATDKVTGWKYFREPSNPNTLARREISVNHMIENAKSFINLMNHNVTSNSSCSLGWLPAMTHLSKSLMNGEIKMENIRVVRYESFSKPIATCVNLFRFIYGPQRAKQVNDQINALCQNTFTASTSASTTSTAVKEIVSLNRNRKNPRVVGHRHLESIKNYSADFNHTPTISNVKQYVDENHRLLRLRTDQDSSFIFRPELVHETCKQRIDDFNYAYERLPVEYQKQLDQIDNALQIFGYKLREPYTFTSSSVLKPWELT